MDKLMHIDSYKIWSYNKEWKNGKQAKTSTIRRMLTSEDGIQGKEFLQLLSDLNDAWHEYETKNIKVEVTFEPHDEGK